MYVKVQVNAVKFKQDQINKMGRVTNAVNGPKK